MKEINVSETLLKQLYNREYKELFLKEYLEDESTMETYVVFMILVGDYEKLLKKDLFEFSSKDILDFFSSQTTSSHTSLRTLFSIMKNYLNWSTGRGLNVTGINPFSTISFKDDVLTMLNIRGLGDKYLSEEQIWELESISKNYQDFSILASLFYSVKGNKCAEIINLKSEDINGVSDTLKLTDEDGSTREIEAPKKLINALKKADGEDAYERRGMAGKGNRTTCTLKSDSEFVFRPTTKNGNAWITAQTCATRVRKLLEEAGYEKTSLNDIYISGKLHALRQIELTKNEKGESLDIEDFKTVQRRFADNDANYNNIKELYNLLYPQAEK